MNHYNYEISVLNEIIDSCLKYNSGDCDDCEASDMCPYCEDNEDSEVK